MSKRTCAVDGCVQTARARGWCSTHYTRWSRWGDPVSGKATTRPPKPKPRCSIEGCENVALSRTWCGKHYSRWQRNGDPTVQGMPYVQGPPEVRFWAKVNKDGPVPIHDPELGACWLWTGKVSTNGYGHFSVNDGTQHWRMVGAHVWAWQEASGEPMPTGMQVDHLCNVRRCVRASHMEVVTPAENMRRYYTRCICRPAGHQHPDVEAAARRAVWAWAVALREKVGDERAEASMREALEAAFGRVGVRSRL